MAKYFEICNANGNLLIDDSSSVIQVLAVTKTTLFSFFLTNTVDSKDGAKPVSQYSAGRGFNIETAIFGHKEPLLRASNFQKLLVFRIDGDISNPPYALCSFYGWKEGEIPSNVAITAHTISTTPLRIQAAWLSLTPYQKKLNGSALVVYDENGGITFDSAMGYVHHIATKSAKINVAAQNTSFTIQVADISGLGLDTSKLFLSIRGGTPAVAQWEGSGNFYRVGYRSFIPRLRVTNNIIYVDFQIWMPFNYTGTIAATYRPAYNFSVYYIPNLKPYND